MLEVDTNDLLPIGSQIEGAADRSAAPRAHVGVYALPAFGDADPEQAWVGEEYVGRKRRVIRIEERADDRNVEHVLHVDHGLPAFPIGEHQVQVLVCAAMKLIVRLAVKDAGEGIPGQFGPISIGARHERVPNGRKRRYKVPSLPAPSVDEVFQLLGEILEAFHLLVMS